MSSVASLKMETGIEEWDIVPSSDEEYEVTDSRPNLVCKQSQGTAWLGDQCNSRPQKPAFVDCFAVQSLSECSTSDGSEASAGLPATEWSVANGVRPKRTSRRRSRASGTSDVASRGEKGTTTHVAQHSSMLESTEVEIGDQCESKDINGHWWQVTVASVNADDTLRVIVADGNETEWPAVHRSNMRRVSSLYQTPFVPSTLGGSGTFVELHTAEVLRGDVGAETLVSRGSPALDTPEFPIGDQCESKDVDGHWWHVTVVGANEDDTFRVIVADGNDTEWPAIHQSNMRRGSSLFRTAPVPPLPLLTALSAQSRNLSTCSSELPVVESRRSPSPLIDAWSWDASPGFGSPRASSHTSGAPPESQRKFFECTEFGTQATREKDQAHRADRDGASRSAVFAKEVQSREADGHQRREARSCSPRHCSPDETLMANLMRDKDEGDVLSRRREARSSSPRHYSPGETLMANLMRDQDEVDALARHRRLAQKRAHAEDLQRFKAAQRKARATRSCSPRHHSPKESMVANLMRDQDEVDVLVQRRRLAQERLNISDPSELFGVELLMGGQIGVVKDWEEGEYRVALQDGDEMFLESIDISLVLSGFIW